MKTKLKTQLAGMLNKSEPMPKLVYCAGIYSEVIQGALHPIERSEALKTLKKWPRVKVIFFIIKSRRLDLKTMEYTGSMGDNIIPVELKDHKVQKICVDDIKTMDILLELQNGISITK